MISTLTESTVDGVACLVGGQALTWLKCGGRRYRTVTPKVFNNGCF